MNKYKQKIFKHIETFKNKQQQYKNYESIKIQKHLRLNKVFFSKKVLRTSCKLLHKKTQNTFYLIYVFILFVFYSRVCQTHLQN